MRQSGPEFGLGQLDNRRKYIRKGSIPAPQSRIHWLRPGCGVLYFKLQGDNGQLKNQNLCERLFFLVFAPAAEA
jgi:hypothetical protein